MTKEERFLRFPEVMDTVGQKKTTIYKMINEGRFPKQLKVGRTTVWIKSEVQAWLQEHIESARQS